MENPTVPPQAQILVIGGGPAGSYAAAALAREGFGVVLLEAAKFPRYHIGEGLLASTQPFLRFIDANDTVKSHGFTVKPGAAFKLNQSNREAYIDFTTTLGPDYTTWNVIRGEFDDLLLRHAAKCGATVVEETKVTELVFEGERPVSATWASRSGVGGQISFDYLVDASGRNGVMSTKYLRNRTFNKNLDNIACWGYWEGAGVYKPGTIRENAVWIEALPDETGWAWFIPLHDGSTSVGIVMDQETSKRKKKEIQNACGTTSLEAHYLEEVQKVSGIMDLLDSATLRNSGKPGGIKSASDYSYWASTYAGDHFRIAGDAGAFIDPFFSSGVHLAFTGALSAAITISASIRGLATEAETQRWHSSKVGSTYIEFLVAVLTAYKQTGNQSMPVLSDAGEDNYDRTFEVIRPVIQGTAAIGKNLVEDIQVAIEFCNRILNPVGGQAVPPESMGMTGSPTTEAKPDAAHIVDPADSKAAKEVPKAHGTMRALRSPLERLATESHFGFKAVLERGRLGLATVAGNAHDGDGGRTN